MEESLPGADYASVEDPSKTDNPPAPCTSSPAGEQTQVEGERSQLLHSQCTQDSHLVSHRLQASTGTTLLSSHPQPPGLSRAGEVTQPPSQSPQSKKKRVSSATSGERHTEVYHELPLSRTVPLVVVIYTTLWHGLVSNQSNSRICYCFIACKFFYSRSEERPYRLCAKNQLHTSILDVLNCNTVVSSEIAHVHAD